jgi:hypothetical protein
LLSQKIYFFFLRDSLPDLFFAGYVLRMWKKKHKEFTSSLAAAFLLHAVEELVPERPQLTGQLLPAQTLQIHAAQHFFLLFSGI